MERNQIILRYLAPRIPNADCRSAKISILSEISKLSKFLKGSKVSRTNIPNTYCNFVFVTGNSSARDACFPKRNKKRKKKPQKVVSVESRNKNKKKQKKSGEKGKNLNRPLSRMSVTRARVTWQRVSGAKRAARRRLSVRFFGAVPPDLSPRAPRCLSLFAQPGAKRITSKSAPKSISTSDDFHRVWGWGRILYSRVDE